MKTKLKSILAAALCAVGLAAFAAEPDAVQLWKGGPYFATCNVGANAPQEPGYYFWWGDTVGYTNSGSAWVSVADGTTTIKFSSSDTTANQTYQKTNQELKNGGFSDDASTGILNAAHDAATAHLGAPWRMMTKDELDKLVSTDYCQREWVDEYKGVTVKGWVVKGKAGSAYENNEVFFPAVGFGDGSSPRYDGSYGYYWSSTPKSDNYSYSAWLLYFHSSEFYADYFGRYNGMSVRAVRDTPPPPEISAVSAEGFLDLTVGDRVAKAEEPIVADPKWGNGKKAFVKIDGEDPAREYPELSIDKWFTSALTAGRYGMTFTSGDTNETAVFWKTGDDWVVHDLPPSSVEGIFFESGKTHLILGTTTFIGDAPLQVEDGAKFEYGTGAGFKGGKLEAPRRYRKLDLGDGLYQIVEKIKGSEDNPWVIGGDGEIPPKTLVEAYTNGTDKLMIVGAGYILDLSEISAGVKSGVKAITVADATVKGSLFERFAGFNKIALTLPDNWQGELPEKGVWYGATDVTLTAWPKAVKNVKVQQRYPWNGLVDIKFALTGEGSVKVAVQVTADGKKLAKPTVTGETTFDLGKGKELKDLRITWDAGTDFGDAELHQKIKVKLTVAPGESD